MPAPTPQVTFPEFEAKFPEPDLSTLAKIPPTLVTLGAGTTLLRIYKRGGTHPTTWRDFRHYGPLDGRFDHHLADALGKPQLQPDRGILYAADDGITCIAECFQKTAKTKTIVIDTVRDEPWLAAFKLTRGVTLLDGTGDWPLKVGASMLFSSGPRWMCRKWSQAIHLTYPTVEGILYDSSLRGRKPCVALYERAKDALPATHETDRALADPAVAPVVNEASNRFGWPVIVP